MSTRFQWGSFCACSVVISSTALAAEQLSEIASVCWTWNFDEAGQPIAGRAYLSLRTASTVDGCNQRLDLDWRAPLRSDGTPDVTFLSTSDEVTVLIKGNDIDGPRARIYDATPAADRRDFVQLTHQFPVFAVCEDETMGLVSNSKWLEQSVGSHRGDELPGLGGTQLILRVNRGHPG